MDRFWAKVNQLPDGGCWLWTGAVVKPNRSGVGGGYGRYKVGGRTRLAHRVMYEWVFGAIPPGLQIDHLCRVRACVNPAHLQAVTPLVNRDRGVLRLLRGQSLDTCARGHAYDGHNGRGRTCRTCGAINSANYKARKALA